MTAEVLVIGGDIQGVQTALDLADCGLPVTIVEESPSLRGGSPDNRPELLRLMPKFLSAAYHPNIHIITNSRVSQISGSQHNLRATIIEQPRYVNSARCTSCGRCQQQCPVEVFLPGTTGNGHKAINSPEYGLRSVPSAYVIEKKGVPPCTAVCPAGINVQGYVSLIAQGKFAEALALITEAAPFLRVLGRVCTHPCEKECARGKIDQPVAICALKRFVSNGSPPPPQNQVAPVSGPARVAIVGAGPAGLTAARDLARIGHRVTVFEALPVPGGMITVGMPRFRLPREVRQADIADIVRFGVEIRTSTPIGPNLTLNDLKRQGYEAILITVGAHRNQKLGIPGEGLSGVINSIALLQALNLKQIIIVGRKVVVVGGGYTGIDSARTAVRLHCERVLVIDRCAKEDLGANPEEIVEAEEEGVEFEYLVTPVRIIGQDNKVVGIECRRMKLGERDKSGRRHITPIEGSEFFIEADTVIVAVGQRPDLSFLKGDTTLTEGKKHIIVDPITMATKIPGIFAAGDAASEPSPIINAIATGRRAAVSIDRFLRGEDISAGRSLKKVTPIAVNPEEVVALPIERQPMPCLRYEDRIGNFEEVDLGFTAEMALSEAKRCLNCAVCSGCRQCQQVCEVNAIDHDMTLQSRELEVAAIVLGGNSATPLRTRGEPGSPGSGESIYTLPPLAANSDLSPASAVASQIIADLMKPHPPVAERRRLALEPMTADTWRAAGGTMKTPPAPSNPRIGVFVCGCGGSISNAIDVPEVIADCGRQDGVVLNQAVGYACAQETAQEIKALARRHNLTHVLVAACACCNLDQICFSCADRRVQCKLNLLNDNGQDNIYYEFVNIREHCAWVHHRQPAAATAKAKSLVRAGLARAKHSQPLATRKLGIERSVLVVGSGVSAMRAAIDLARQGFPTTLIPQHKPDHKEQIAQNLTMELASSGAMVLNETKLTNIAGVAGQYRATLVQNGKAHQVTTGAIIFDMSGFNQHQNEPATDTELSRLLPAFGNGNQPLVMAPSGMEPVVSRLPGVFLCGREQSPPNVVEALTQGSAAATKASVWLRKGNIDIVPTLAVVDQMRCRGCGTCQSICQFGAVTMVERTPGIFSALIDAGLCRGCGICVAHCPSGALSQDSGTDRQIIASLEAILS